MSTRTSTYPTGHLPLMPDPVPDIVWVSAWTFSRKRRLSDAFLRIVIVASLLAAIIGQAMIERKAFGHIWFFCFMSLFLAASFVKLKVGTHWRCRHCGSLNPRGEPERKAELGAIIVCADCGNSSRKTTSPK